MVDIFSVKKAQLEEVNLIALETWDATYKEILTPEQSAYMIDWMYSLASLEKQFDEGHQFFILAENNVNLGFIGVERGCPDKQSLKIHKLYVKPTAQGKRVGLRLIQHLAKEPVGIDLSYYYLNVNRFNSAVGFYQKLGFETVGEEDIDIGRGYLMEDYIMRLKVG